MPKSKKSAELLQLCRYRMINVKRRPILHAFYRDDIWRWIGIAINKLMFASIGNWIYQYCCWRKSFISLLTYWPHGRWKWQLFFSLFRSNGGFSVLPILNRAILNSVGQYLVSASLNIRVKKMGSISERFGFSRFKHVILNGKPLPQIHVFGCIYVNVKNFFIGNWIKKMGCEFFLHSNFSIVGFSTTVFRENIFQIVILLDGDCRKKIRCNASGFCVYHGTKPRNQPVNFK